MTELRKRVSQTIAKTAAKTVANMIREHIEMYGREAITEASTVEYDLLENIQWYNPRIYNIGLRINLGEYDVGLSWIQKHVYRILEEKGVTDLTEEEESWIDEQIATVYSFLKKDHSST